MCFGASEPLEARLAALVVVTLSADLEGCRRSGKFVYGRAVGPEVCGTASHTAQRHVASVYCI